MPDKNKAIIVNRASSQKQNPALQEKDCLALAERKGYEVIKILTEIASAGKSKQKSIYEAEQLAIKEKADIIVWKYDRAFRNKKDFADFMLKMYELYNIKVYSVQEEWVNELWNITEMPELTNIPFPYNESVKEQLKSTWKLMVRIIGLMAEEEIKDKGARVRLAVIKKQGEKTKSYKGNVWGRKPLSQNIINKIMELHKQGKSIRQISKEVIYWDKNGHSRNISVAGVHKILKENSKQEAIAGDSINYSLKL